MIFSCFKGSFDLYICEGKVNYSSSLKGLGDILSEEITSKRKMNEDVFFCKIGIYNELVWKIV